MFLYDEIVSDRPMMYFSLSPNGDSGSGSNKLQFQWVSWKVHLPYHLMQIYIPCLYNAIILGAYFEIYVFLSYIPPYYMGVYGLN